MSKKRIGYVAVLNIASLSTHQADAAFQREWELFGVPGGIAFFLIFNLVALSILLLSLQKLAMGDGPSNFLIKYVIPFTGLFTFLLHAIFIAIGHREFTQPISLVILVLILVLSILQLVIQLGTRQQSKS